MGRRTTLPVGTIHDTWLITGRTSYAGATNQQLALKCTVCGTARTTWSANLRQGKVACAVCAASAKALDMVGIAEGIVLAYYGSHITILPMEGRLPTGVPLFRVLSDGIALPLNTSMPASAIPEPDVGYVAYLKVPLDYLPYYKEDLGDVPEHLIEAARAYWHDNVVEPTNAVSELYLGSQSKWYENDTEYTYIYWKDTRSWPKDQPPKPKVPKEPKAPREPANEFPSLKSASAPPTEPASEPAPTDPVLRECQRIAVIPVHSRTFEEDNYLAVESAKRRAAKAEVERAALNAEWDAEDAENRRRKGL